MITNTRGTRVVLSAEGLVHFASSRRSPPPGTLRSLSPDGKYAYIQLDGNQTVTRYAASFWMDAPKARRAVQVNMSPAGLRAHAKKWMFAGFAASGRGLNGETMPPEKYPALRSILDAYFDNIYDES